MMLPSMLSMLDNSASVSNDSSAQIADRRELRLDGEVWVVYERPAGAGERNRGPSLVFESRRAIRRVRDYPLDWKSMPDAALRTLSWTR